MNPNLESNINFQVFPVSESAGILPCFFTVERNLVHIYLFDFHSNVIEYSVFPVLQESNYPHRLGGS